MLVEVLDAFRDRLGEAHLSRDIGAAMAPCLDELAGDLAALEEYVHDGAEAFCKAGLQPRVRKHEAQGFRKAAVDRFDVALERHVISEEQLADARSIAAAAKVLQQNGVVQLRSLCIIETNFFADVQRDPAAADAVAGGLALDHVERMAERTENLCEAKFRGAIRSLCHIRHHLAPTPHRAPMAARVNIWTTTGNHTRLNAGFH